jgi:hypothetical protein
MRILPILFLSLLLPTTAQAVEAPAGQTRLDSQHVLRGSFVEDRDMPGLKGPLHSTGHFVVAPGHGLIWGMEKPFPTSTIITPTGIAQDVGGMAIKLPAKNLRHLYNMVGGALAGDWSDLESDFEITRSAANGHWQMLLVPRPDSKVVRSYESITVTGNRFVESIAMAKPDGTSDIFTFSDAVLSPAPLAAPELASFNEVR